MTKNNNPEWTGFENLKEDNELFPSDLNYSIKNYPKNELIFRQGDIYDALYILIEGSVKTEMITESGSLLGIELISAPRPLAPAFLFSDNNRFPVDVTTLKEVEVLRIPKEEVMRLMTTQPNFMKQFLTHNANRTQFLTNRLQLLSIKIIKGKLAHFLLENSAGEGIPFELKRNQTELANFFGVARPSLARSLSEMVQDGNLSINRKEYTILNAKGLRELLV
jgi:CRP-like cAMP-binding protein